MGKGRKRFQKSNQEIKELFDKLQDLDNLVHNIQKEIEWKDLPD